ncbi:hypothetical protein B0T25DRAFT_602775 [Lasiosphaeria hispida]|uniref:Uncharacterized protein n=1 Tax=Lasiosphaeria hispida TaxID=260671 RepID=A0AAJ0MF51_9PEZI|nr:hypothetical protein B0T25DRAFT_602775 [Lasiosphaeria hispida]
MEADDRSTFLNLAQPQGLPFELTTNLPKKIIDWIYHKYAPTYISSMLMQKAKDYCNIFNTLTPGEDFAETLFEKVVSFAVASNYSSPYVPLDPAQAEKDKTWLTDVMRNLVTLVVTDDTRLNKDASGEFKSEIVELMNRDGIEKNAEAMVMADEVVSEGVAAMAMSMGTILDGARALRKLAGFKGAAKVVNTVLNKLTPRAWGRQLDGRIYCERKQHPCAVGRTTQRAIAIIATLATAADVIGRSITLFKEIKEWRASGGAAGTAPELTAEEAAEVENLVPGRGLQDDLSLLATGEKVVSTFALGIALTVAMSIDLANHWDDYNDVGKALNVLQVIVQGLSVLLEAVMTEVALAASTVLTVAVPILGAILVIISVVVMLLLTFLSVTKPKEPKLTPVEAFLKNTAYGLLESWLSPNHKSHP